MPASRPAQLCTGCGEPTGRTTEDEIRIGDDGPLCEECHAERKCKTCFGDGQIRVCRDDNGRVDYIRGRPTAEMVSCDSCDGEGYR